LEALKIDEPQWFYVLVACRRDGKKQSEVALKFAVSQGTVSSWLGRSEAYLRGILGQAGVV
jgi:transposase